MMNLYHDLKQNKLGKKKKKKPGPYLGMSAEGIPEWFEILQKIYPAHRG